MDDIRLPILLLLLLIGCCVLVFVLTHLRPLTESEVAQLARRRRKKQIQWYFSFTKREFIANRDFKKAMNPDGHFRVVAEPLFNWPSLAAAMLKYKKHEWIVVAFERGQRVDLVWVNKGIDRTQVALHLPTDRIAQLSKQGGYVSILVSHNHPNPNPELYDFRHASQQDFRFANALAGALNAEGLNLIKFVCERGRHYEYFRSISESFIPLSDIVGEITGANGVARLSNLALHLKRVFG